MGSTELRHKENIRTFAEYLPLVFSLVPYYLESASETVSIDPSLVAFPTAVAEPNDFPPAPSMESQDPSYAAGKFNVGPAPERGFLDE